MSFSPKKFEAQARAEGHSDEFIRETLAYAENLRKKKLPVIFSRNHLAMLLGVQYTYLTHLIESRNGYYQPFKLAKRRGGFREIMAPREELKAVQRWILVHILDKVKLHKACKGFRKGISIADNAAPHEGKQYILKVDLLKYFDTITEQRVYGVFKSLGYHPNLARDLAMLCTAKHSKRYWNSFSTGDKEELCDLIEEQPPVLPQGAPTSPALANFIATHLDHRMSRMAAKMKIKYSRYADDLTFSGNKYNLPKKLIHQVIEEEGLHVNKKKVKMFKRGMKQYVTGLTVTNGVHVSKKYRKEVMSHIYFAQKYGPEGHLEWLKKTGKIRQYKYSFRDWLQGCIAHIYAVDKKHAETMMREFNKIDWKIDTGGTGAGELQIKEQ